MSTLRTLGMALLALGAALTIVAVAEDVTVSTYYPSPKGVYQELRTTSDVHVGGLDAATARLHVTQAGAANAVLVEDSASPDATPFVIDQTGNVGVGTTAPTALLHVSGSNALVKLDRTGPIIAGNPPQPDITFLSNNNTLGVIAGFGDATYNGGLRFYTAPSGGATSEQVRITTTGNVGIGTTAPGAKLQIGDGTAAAGLIINDNVTAGASPTITQAAANAVFGGPTVSADAWHMHTGAGGQLKIVKGSNCFSAPVTLDCGAGWQIVACGEAHIWTDETNTRNIAAWAMIGLDNASAAGGSACTWDAFGTQSYTAPALQPCNAAIAQCAR